MKTYDELFSKLTMGRRYEVWFFRAGLGDGSGAWSFRICRWIVPGGEHFTEAKGGASPPYTIPRAGDYL